MKETDTENPIEWPAWCYTANKPPTDIVDVAPAQANTAAALGFQKSAVPYQPPSVDQRHTTVKRRPPADTTPPKRPKLLPAAGRSSTQASDIELAAAKRLADALNAIAAANNIIGQTASPPPPLPPHQQHRQHRAASKTPTPSPPEAPAELNAGEKMLSDRSLLLSRFNAIEHSVKKYSGDSGGTKALAGDAARGGAHANASSTAAAAAAAAAYLYFEKAKNEKFGSGAREYSSSQLTDSLEEALADAGKQHYGSSSAASHKSSGSSGSNFTGSHSNSAGSLAEAHTGSNHLHLHQQHRDHFNNNTVKRERLSPATTNGGDVPARSRSATPSSFRGTPPHQSLRNSPPQSVMPIHNLSTNLLNSIQQAAASQKSSAASSGSTSQAASGGSAGNQLPTDFTMPTCSDFMRSMAAKYNNMNPNDSQTTRRSSFFDSASPSTSLSRGLPGTSKHAAGTASTSVSMLGRKEPSPTVGALSGSLPPPPPASISPADVAAAALKTQNVQIAAAAAAAANAAAGSNSVSPFMASLLSSLPFSQGVFPPLIDMSSTQALVTLARAAKEAEIQQVLRAVQQPKQHSNSSRASLSPRPTLTAAIQQAAQFITPALLQLQQHQQQQQAQSLSPTSRHSSPVHNLSSAKHSASASLSAGRDKTSSNLVASPLDLSSQPPPAKRFKAESTSSQSSGTADFIGSDTRRVSFTTVTPSPPLSTTPVMDASTPAKDNQRVSSSKARQCQAQSEEVQSWTVDDVCTFVGEIDICSEYIQHFRDQQIDGSGLPLLTEDHLVNSLGMKLGPALKLRSVLAKKLGGPCPCVACVAQAQQILALQAAGGAAPAAPAAPSSSAAAHSLAVESTTTTTTSTTTSPVALRVSSGGPSAAAAGGDSGSDCTTTHQSIGNGAFSLYETNSCGTASGSSSSSNPATTVPAKSGNSLPTICHNNEAKSNDGNNNDSSSSNCNASGDDAVEAAVLSIKQRKRSGSGDSADSGGGGS